MLNAIDAIRVFASDFNTTKDFYVDTLGFVIGFEATGVCVFDLPGTKLILEEVDLSDSDTSGMVGRFTGISFAVSDLKKVHKELKAKGVKFEGKPEFEQGGTGLAHFSDPDQNIFTLIQYPEN